MRSGQMSCGMRRREGWCAEIVFLHLKQITTWNFCRRDSCVQSGRGEAQQQSRRCREHKGEEPAKKEWLFSIKLPCQAVLSLAAWGVLAEIRIRMISRKVSLAIGAFPPKDRRRRYGHPTSVRT